MDWIALHVPGTSDGAYLAWTYVSCSQTPGAARANGSCPFTVPSGLGAGTYEIRLFADNQCLRLPTSNAISVTTTAGGSTSVTVSPTTIAQGSSITAMWNGIVSPTPMDWLGLCAW